jgi:hypothetical protein
MVAATDEKVKNKVLEEWVSTPDVSARAVSRRFLRKHGKDLVGDRTIQTIVGEAKRAAPSEPFPCTLWRPWSDSKDPDETFYLLQLHQIARQGGGLRCHEAAWAKRLRPLLAGLETHQVLELTRAYAKRERASYFLNTAPYTEDLDSFVMSQMWLDEEHLQRYAEALAAGAVPVPFLNASEAFLKEIAAQGHEGLGEDTWKLLDEHPIYHHVFKDLADPSDPLPDDWPNIVLAYLDDPGVFDAVLSPINTASGGKAAPKEACAEHSRSALAPLP